MVLTARGAEQQSQGVGQRARVYQPRPGPGQGRQAAAVTAASPGRATDRADASTGKRPTNCRATAASTTRSPARTSPQSGASKQPILPAREVRTSCSTALGDDGGIHALFVMGFNPAVSAPNATMCRRALAARFCCVSDFFLSETAELADVVLPSAQWAEEEGTMTNLEGRVIRRRRVVAPPAGVRTDLRDYVRPGGAPSAISRFLISAARRA